MPTIQEVPGLEVPDKEKIPLLRTAPPLAETAVLEDVRGMTAVRDTFSRQTLNKSNAAASNLLRDTLKATMKLSKTVFGGVSNVFTVFSGLRRIFGGI